MAMVSSTPAGSGLPMGLMPGALPSDQASRHTLKMTAMRLLPGQSQSCCFIAKRRSLPANTLRFFRTRENLAKPIEQRQPCPEPKPQSTLTPERKGEIMRKSATKVNATRRATSCAGGLGLAAMLLAALLPCAMSGGAVAQDSNAIVMKLATATLNDAQHEWMRRFAVAIEK